MVKNMSDWEFKPEDFDYKVDGRLHPTMAKDLANKKLQEWLASAQVVYGLHNYKNSMGHECIDRWSPVKDFAYDKESTHKALLIKIEPLKRCEHPKEKVKEAYKAASSRFGDINRIFKCDCGAKVQPTSFEEIE